MTIAEAVSEGIRIPFTPSSDVIAGVPQELDDIVVIPTSNIDANVEGTGAVEGLFRVAKTTTSFPTVPGTLVYYDVADGEVNADDSGNKLLGVSMETTIEADTTVLVKLAQATA